MVGTTLISKMSANFLNFDEAPSSEVSIAHANPSEHLGSGDNIGPLGDFLKRPIKIATYNWIEGTSFRKTLYPWYEYLKTDSIRNKIVNYSKFRGDMKLTILINSNPFKYGCIVAGFKPLVGATAKTLPTDPQVTITEVRDQSGGQIDDDILSTANDALVASLAQRQHVFIYPQETTKVEMTLPFVWFQDHFPMLQYIDPTDIFAWRKLGKVDFCSTAPLASCSAPSLNPITIEIFASMENWELAGPSLQREADEYDPDKPISTTASAIANAADSLTSIPFIGAYATATSMIARAIGSIAAWFGFSNVNYIGPIAPVKMIKATRWADTEAMVPLPKLTLDPKNELSIDPAIVGLPSVDHMVFDTICEKPFFAGITAWNDDDVVGTLLQSGVVAPSYYHVKNFVPLAGETAMTPSQVLTMAPATWVAQNFQFWRGDMKIRFKVLCTKFHKGRLRFVYDPAGWHTNFSEGKVYSKILDLNSNNEAEIIIPYQGFRPVIEHPRMISQYQSGNPAPYMIPDVSNNKIFTNGVSTMSGYYDVSQIAGSWGLFIMTDLSSPLDAPAYIQTWVSFHNNEFFAPIDPFPPNTTQDQDLSTYTYIAPTDLLRQSAEFQISHDVVPAESKTNTTPLTVCGETCKSVRQLLHRWGFADVMVTGNSISELNNNFHAVFLKRRFPLYHGRSLATTDRNAAGTLGFHHGGHTALNYFTPAFVARRGGINWRFEPFVSSNGDQSTVNWGGAFPYPISVTVSRGIENLKQFSGVIWWYSGISEIATAILGVYPGTAANTREFKRRNGALGCRSLRKGAEINLPISYKTNQMPEVTMPDYNPNRGIGCNPYIDAGDEFYDLETNEGGLTSQFSQRDCLLVEACYQTTDLTNTAVSAPSSFYPVLKSYACGAPDFSLMGFINVPTMYGTPNFQDPF